MSGMSINQFMWAFQPHFRISAGQAVRRVLANIGIEADPTVVLIGFANHPEARHRICVEPENGPLTQEHLAGVETRGREIYEADPESQMMHSNRDLHDRIQSGLARMCRARAIAEVLEEKGLYGYSRAFVSASTPIGMYDVHTCVLLHSELVDALPAFENEVFDRIYVGRSLLHEAIAECLRRADDALYRPDPGRGLEVLGEAKTIVAAAANRFTSGCMVRSGSLLAGEVFDALCAITSLAYERAEATGSIVFARSDHPNLEVIVRFRRSVAQHQARAVRKLLETTNEQTSLLCDEQGFYGLGRVREDADDIFTVFIPAHATWLLSHEGTELMKVSYRLAALPRPLLDRRLFVDTVDRVIGPADNDALWALVESAASSGHGSTLVVSSDAAREADRLAGQSTPIAPARLGPADVARLGRIDGAVIVDTEAACHAIGVILDGDARGVGDPARGSRFNSSVRYQMATESPAVVVVVSDDGTVDLVPSLRPRVSRARVDGAVTDFVSAATADPEDGELFGRTHDRVLRVAFYLNAEQCDQVSDLYEAQMNRRLRQGGIKLSRERLVPSPEMDDSYFLD